MTTSPYSIDSRKKVIRYLERGKSQRSASKIFMLNLSTVNRCFSRYKKEVHVLPRKRLGKKPSLTLIELESYIKSNPKFKSEGMGKHFGITRSGALYLLKNLGYSYKKILYLHGSE